MTAEGAEKSQQCHKYFFNAVRFASGRPQVRIWGARAYLHFFRFEYGAPNLLLAPGRGGSRRGDWDDRPPKTYESKFFHHDFAQFGKQYLRFKAILLPLFCHSSFVKYTSSLLQ